MGALFSKPKTPAIPEVKPLPPEPKEGSAGISAGEEFLKKRKKAKGLSSTILAGISDDGATGTKTVLGA